MDKFDDPDPIAPHPCPNCQQWTERGIGECIHCDHELNEYEPSNEHVAVDPVHAETDLMTMILEKEVTADDLESVRKLEGVIKKRSQLFNQLDQLIDLARRDQQGEFTPVKGAPMFMVLVILFIFNNLPFFLFFTRLMLLQASTYEFTFSSTGGRSGVHESPTVTLA